MKNTIGVCLLALLIFAGCKSNEETVSGNYKIIGYTVNGSDSLPQIGILHLEGRFTMTPANGNGSQRSINYNLETVNGDSTYSFGGNWVLAKKSISFFPRTFLKYSKTDTFIVHTSFNTNDSGPYPVLFPLAGRWNIKKQGSNSLELKKEANREIELHLRRQ